MIMTFRALLEQGHSKVATFQIVNEIVVHPKKMDELMQCFIKGPVQITQRAAWPLSFVAQKKPELLDNYYKIFIDLLNKPNKHPSINRNIMRTLQFLEIPKEYEGELLDVSFLLLNSSNESIAIKVFCMTVIFNFSKKYPDIIPELKASIEALLPEGSAGIKSRGNKILDLIN